MYFDFGSGTSLHHNHIHADSEESYRLMPSKDPDSPAQVDRLIAFLHSHFGTVEFLSAEQVNSEFPGALIEQDEKKPNIGQEGEEETKPDGSARQRIQALGPVIRVRLDEHFADVDVEDLVSEKLESSPAYLNACLRASTRLMNCFSVE